jgi:sulfite dehydrogenase (cytochrome) subunit B
MASKRMVKGRLPGHSAAIAMAALWLCAPSAAQTRTYALPDEAVRLRPGPDVEKAEANCVVCHSMDYIKVQPPGKGKAFWTAEVNKMIKVFGAPIAQEDAAKIADYLAVAY